ncbi:MAG: hypothetical protein CME70_16925 [Halobacteriovorax sp.]|nr:hypothetical protein [Halobacteriovorax sp.]
MKKTFSLTGLLLFATLAQAKVTNSYSLSKLMNKSENLSSLELFWLGQNGPLNKNYGVTGSYGPFGILGPFGDEWWNATPWINGTKSWKDFANKIGAIGGPLSEYGPLLITTEFGQALSSYDFGPNSGEILAAGGVLHSVGPSGLNGVMGVGGPLGPHGIHGYKRDEIGKYRNKNKKIVKSIMVKTIDGKKRFPLYELYKEGIAKELTDLDSSFVAQDKLSSSSDKHQYKITASSKRWVNITLVSAYTLDSLSLRLLDEKGNIIEVSDDSYRSNFISFKTNKKTALKIEVSLKNSFQFLMKPYRLFVTEAPAGATEVKR